MTDLQYLKDLLPLMKVNGVTHIKMAGLELSFHVEQHMAVGSLGAAPVPAPDNSVEQIADTLRKQEESLPPDLRADSLMDEDKILNWSSPDQTHGDELPLPLTGDQPL